MIQHICKLILFFPVILAIKEMGQWINSTNFKLKIWFTHFYVQPFSGCNVMKLYIPHLAIKSLLVKTMPCWAVHTLYQLMSFKVMRTPLHPPPPPSSSRFPLHLLSNAQSTYLLQFFVLYPFPDLRDRSLKCHVSSWLWRRFVGHLLFFLSFRHCELHAPCKQL